MANLTADEICSEIVSRLSGTAGASSAVLTFGQSKVLFTSARKIASANTSEEPKPYPKVASDLPDDYDSWLS